MKTLFFGLQYILKTYFEGYVITQEGIDEAEEYFGKHFGTTELFNKAGWQYILDKHDGQLPVIIKAVPEGTLVPFGNVLMTIENTDPMCWWLTNYLETLLVQTWYPTSVATQSYYIKQILKNDLDATADNSDGVNFKLHDFGFRGVSSVESAGIGGCAHLVNFMGTDTIHALKVARDVYGEDMAGFSIPASEHSTMTAWGPEGEVDAMENMLDQYPTGIVACVSDSYDIINACTNVWGKALKDKVLARDGTLVVRPDSGDPVDTVFAVVEALGEAFGHVVNSKGYKMLPPQVRIIQGDGVDLGDILSIGAKLMGGKWSTDNIAYGMGGALLQKLDRDTQRFAFKCSSVTVNNDRKEVWKRPVGSTWKSSKKGRLGLIKTPSGYATVPEGTPVDLLATVFEDGVITKMQTLKEIRERSNCQ